MSDPDPLRKASAPRERTFRRKPIRIGTAVSNIRCGLPAMKALPERSKPANPRPASGLPQPILFRPFLNRGPLPT